jgi:hypothetical protein
MPVVTPAFVNLGCARRTPAGVIGEGLTITRAQYGDVAGKQFPARSHADKFQVAPTISIPPIIRRY